MSNPWTTHSSNAVYRLAMDSCPDLVFVKDQDCRILYANRAMLELYPPEMRGRVIGTTTVESFSKAEADKFLAKDRETFAVGRTTVTEEIACYTGRIRTFSTTKTRFLEDGGDIRLLGVATDITELVEREREVASANAMLERFAAIAAHDLVSPLTSVGMMLQLIELDRTSALSAPAADQLRDAGRMIAAMSNQVAALLTMAKARRGASIDRQPTNLSVVADRVALGLSSLLTASGATLTRDTLPTVSCEPALIEALLQNLVENSVKYRSDADPVIHIAHDRRGLRDVFRVSDNGVGLPAQEAEKAFALGHQLDPAAPGAGLGLGMCRAIVDLHGGTMWAEVAATPGTAICFTLAMTD